MPTGLCILRPCILTQIPTYAILPERSLLQDCKKKPEAWEVRQQFYQSVLGVELHIGTGVSVSLHMSQTNLS